jgi:hypothetical protein
MTGIGHTSRLKIVKVLREMLASDVRSGDVFELKEEIVEEEAKTTFKLIFRDASQLKIIVDNGEVE